MKFPKMLLALAVVMCTTQSAHASYCDTAGVAEGVLGWFAIVTITSAPTGTTVLLSSNCLNRDAILNLKDAAIEYRMTGEMNPILLEGLREGKKASPELTEEQILSKFIHMTVQLTVQ